MTRSTLHHACLLVSSRDDYFRLRLCCSCESFDKQVYSTFVQFGVFLKTLNLLVLTIGKGSLEVMQTIALLSWFRPCIFRTMVYPCGKWTILHGRTKGCLAEFDSSDKTSRVQELDVEGHGVRLGRMWEELAPLLCRRAWLGSTKKGGTVARHEQVEFEKNSSHEYCWIEHVYSYGWHPR